MEYTGGPFSPDTLPYNHGGTMVITNLEIYSTHGNLARGRMVPSCGPDDGSSSVILRRKYGPDCQLILYERS
jgi:hypothetical protein